MVRLAVSVLLRKEERFGGLTQAKKGEVSEASLESLILVDKLEQFEHFTSGSDLLDEFRGGGDPRILRKVLVITANQTLEMTVQKVS